MRIVLLLLVVLIVNEDGVLAFKFSYSAVVLTHSLDLAKQS